MKKNYQTPAMQVINIEPATMCAGSEVNQIGSNAEMKYGGPDGGSGSARSRDGGGYWDDEE